MQIKRAAIYFLIISIYLFSFKIPAVFASTLYSNTFTSTYSGFTEFFGNCSPGPTGLTCSGTDAFYDTYLPTLKCISADIDLNNIRDGLVLADGIFTSAVGISASGTLAVSDGHLHVYSVNPNIDQDIGINTPAPGHFHNYSICKNSNTYTFYFDSSIVSTQNYLGHSGGYFGFEAKLGTIITNLVAIDTLPTLTPTPTPTPTPTLAVTPTPTPTLSPGQLNVPLVKQTSNPWQALEYDTAHTWASTTKTIHDWGCALTSAVMVLQYNGILKLPDNSPLNPGTLNAWLKSYPGGYVGNGLVNWIAIQKLTQLARLAFNNPGYTYDALVYKRVNSANTAQLTQDLTNNIPDILEEPGHFVVATGKQNTTYTINDPYFPRNTLNDGYNNTFLTLGRFVPSHTDLSYILITADPSLTLTLTNSANQSVGTFFIQQPLTNDTDFNPSGSPLGMYYVEEPGDGLYTLTVTSSGPSQPFLVNEYLYDISGNVTIATVSGTTNNNSQTTISVTSKKVTFQTFYSDSQSALDLKLLSKGVYNAIVLQIKNIQKEVESGQISVAKLHLNVISLLLQVMPGISQQTKDLLQSDITALLQTI